jgi:hypothetical protein
VKNGYWLNILLEIKRFTIYKILKFFIWFPIVKGKKAEAFADT